MREHSVMEFYFGTMGSRKTLELIVDEYRLRNEENHETLVVKPETDTKADRQIQTRAFSGATLDATIMPSDAEASEFVMDEIASRERELDRSEQLAKVQAGLGSRARTLWTVYLDEVNFFDPDQIKSLRTDVVDRDIADVKMYGLMFDAFGNPFPGSQAALFHADHVTQFHKTCDNKGCNRPANSNARILHGQILREGPQNAVDLADAPYSYMALCHHDYESGIVLPNGDSYP